MLTSMFKDSMESLNGANASILQLFMNSLIKIFVLISVLSASISCYANSNRPNILFILTEDQGAHLSFLGTSGLQTPHMDSLAKSGVYFRNAFVAYPVCSPSKAAIYTSLHNHTNGILNNTPNFHKPALELTVVEAKNPLYVRNRISQQTPTLIERLKSAGYYQGVTHKLHVAPNEKFPYDEFMPGEGRGALTGFLERAQKLGKPWHLFLNVGNSHRPFPNSDKTPIRVKPAEVKLPAFLPDTPIIRQDWAEYLAAIEKADQVIGESLAVLREAGQMDNTIIICLGGDHGPAFPHGKMTLYDLGLRVTLSISGPGFGHGVQSNALVSELDITPTLLDVLGLDPIKTSHGMSLRPVLESKPAAKGHEYVFAEISDRGNLPNDGMQERSVCDGRWHLIFRTNPAPSWRQVQADSKDPKPWGNRSYDEIVRVKDKFPEAFRVLAEMDPQTLHGKVPELEIFDLQSDPDEMRNLSSDEKYRGEKDRLFSALKKWNIDTQDTSVKLP